LTGLYFQQSSALKIQLKQKNAQADSGLHIQQSSVLKKQKIQKQFQASLIIF